MSQNAQANQSAFSVPEDIQSAVTAMADDARTASRALATADRSRKDRALQRIAEAIDAQREVILRSNASDVSHGKDKGLAENLVDRLTLTDERIDGLIDALHNLASQVDPIGEILDGQTLPNGLRVSRVRVPLGVVGAIYEARPNVTVDIAGLALKSGNAAMLRGGSAALETNKTLVGIIRDALDNAGFPMDCVQTVDEFGRDGANALMLARGKVDVLIPRGGGNLIQSVVNNARVPVIETGEGNVHIYLDSTATEEQAVPLVVNSKVHRPSACNSAETLLIQRDAPAAGSVLPPAAPGSGLGAIALRMAPVLLATLVLTAGLMLAQPFVNELIPEFGDETLSGTYFGVFYLASGVTAAAGNAAIMTDRKSVV